MKRTVMAAAAVGVAVVVGGGALVASQAFGASAPAPVRQIEVRDHGHPNADDGASGVADPTATPSGSWLDDRSRIGHELGDDADHAGQHGHDGAHDVAEHGGTNDHTS